MRLWAPAVGNPLPSPNTIIPLSVICAAASSQFPLNGRALVTCEQDTSLHTWVVMLASAICLLPCARAVYGYAHRPLHGNAE